MKRPFLPVALLYSAGVILGNFGETELAALFAAGVLFGGAALVWERARLPLLAGLAVASGWAGLQCRLAGLSPCDLGRLAAGRASLAAVRGVVDGAPSERVFVRGERESWHTLAVVDLAAARFQGSGWERASGRVQTTTPGVLGPGIRSGQPVEVDGVLASAPAPAAEGLFDYGAFLERQGIAFQLKAGSAADWRLAGPLKAPSWAERFGAWAMAALGRGMPVQDEALRLQWAMILGWKTALTGEVSEPFMRTGTMHIFAISGLHIALIAGMLAQVARLVNAPRGVSGALIIPLIWFYTAATEWQPSAIRSAVMMTVIIASWALKRPCDMLNSLAAAGFFILLWDPRQLFQASFQLSFFVVLSLVLLDPVFERWRHRILDADSPSEPAPDRPAWMDRLRWSLLGLDPWRLASDRPWPMRVWHVGLDWVARGLSVSLAAFAGSAPLIAHYFHLMTPVSLLANLIVVPLSGLALMAGLASLLTAPWWPWASVCFNHSGWFWMKLMLWVTDGMAAWPGGCWNIQAPGPVTWVLCAATVAALASGGLAGPHWRRVTAGLAALGLAWALTAWMDQGATRLVVLPLNGGHAVFIDAPGSRDDLLVDCGDERSVEFVTRPFLAAQGVNGLEALVLTHGDIRHTGGATNLTARFPPGRVCISGHAARSPSYRAFVARLNRRPGLAVRVRRGDRIGPWEVAHPAAPAPAAAADDECVVLRGRAGGVPVLLCSDLTARGLDAIVRAGADLRADLVVTGLPSRGEPLPDGLLDRIQPRWIVVADSLLPATARAQESLRLRLARRGRQVFLTRETGALTFEIKDGRVRIRGSAGLALEDTASPRPPPRPPPDGDREF